ncbi:flagellar hook-associated protein FlgL [Pseudomonas chlororaphis subsp. aurantiaca]|uniref:flagellar hook-associated protein FlgL n=1 Tax=Pseudomonas chlororaphis TaxID=587753 RepID=UPI0027DDA243|nr:flagellar hook-associated protein FlgL [Pseudomonas chlororaphis]WMI97588.1 flagellar hook-associated protein FlgL [Pseudomonas chlororaphis subsp. aurantiaca]
MRISDAQSRAMIHGNMNRSAEAVAKLQSQIGTGLRIQLPSDDPIASARLLRIQREQSSLEQYDKNIGKVSGNLSIQETHLKSSADAVGSIRDLLLWANTDSNSGEDRSAIASQLSGLEQSLVSFINAKDESGNYLFSGTRTDKPAVTFDSTSGSYAMTGNDRHRQAEVGNGVLLGANVTAKDVMGANADLLNQLHALVDGLKTAPNDPATHQQLKDTLEQLDATHGSILETITDLGGRQNTLTLLANSNADVSLANQKVEGDLSHLDMGGAMLQVDAFKLSVEASQKVYSRMSTMSLFDLM